MPSTSIADALFGKTQQAVLGLLFGQPERSFYLRELVTAAGGGASQVQRELAQLSAAGLVTREPRGNQVWFKANATSPVFGELKSLITKTTGIADVVRATLEPFSGQITAAFIYGSVARGEHDSDSDVDLMVVGSLPPSRLAPAQLTLRERLGRPVKAVVYTAAELKQHVRQGEPFLTNVLRQPKIWLIGSDAEIGVPNEQGTRQPRRRKATQV
ncbi:MAG TPA: nucleotidyltransferase domain-containing protein [Burkholderiaceae bacterium]|nr:nucleotidyltransferase domain-containing protein [Burkholderiaceae bacterium]